MLALRTLLHRLEYHEPTVVVLVQLQNRRLVVHPIAVVRSRPQRHQLLVEPVDIPLLHQLMRTHYQVHLI